MRNILVRTDRFSIEGNEIESRISCGNAICRQLSPANARKRQLRQLSARKKRHSRFPSGVRCIYTVQIRLTSRRWKTSRERFCFIVGAKEIDASFLSLLCGKISCGGVAAGNLVNRFAGAQS